MSIVLRPLRSDDSARVLAWRNAPHVSAHMYTDNAIGEAEHARWLTSALAAPDCRYWIILLDERAVGVANLVGIDPRNRRADWGFYLGEEAARGSGVGRAALYVLINQAFGPFGLRRLTCTALAENEAAWTLYESMGFVREGRLRDHIQKEGRFHDVLTFALLDQEWAAARSGVEAKLLGTGIDPSSLAVREA